MFLSEAYTEMFDIPDALNLGLLFFGAIEIFSFSFVFLFLPINIILYEKKSKKLMSLLMLFFFWVLKIFYFPLFISLYPKIHMSFIPFWIKEGGMYILFIGYILFGFIPLLISFLYFIDFFTTKKDSKRKTQTVYIVMPIYNENLQDLIQAIDSVCHQVTKNIKINLFCSIDDDTLSPMLFGLLKHYNIYTPETQHQKIIDFDTMNKDIRVFICRNKHSGKKGAQKGAWNYITQLVQNPSKEHILFIDSDMVLDKYCVSNLVDYMKHNPKVVATTGIISLKSQTRFNFLHHYQLPEYIVGQLITRATESFMGSTVCLPGALTMMSMKTMISITDSYFNDFNVSFLLDYHRYHLGEDRFLTHLLMEKGKTSMCIDAHAETVGIDRWSSFFKQRRRWLQGSISNEAWMLSSLKLWKKYPFLLFFKTMEFCNRFLSVYAIIYMIRYAFFKVNHWYTPFLFFSVIIVQLGILLIYCIKRNTYSIMITYFLYIITSPFVQTLVYVFTILTFNKRTWGGPRIQKDLETNKLF